MKRLHLITLALASLYMFTACDILTSEKEPEPEVEFEQVSELTPGQHQRKLEDIAIEFVNYFDIQDAEAIMKSAVSFSEYSEYLEEFGGSSADVPEYMYAAEMVTDIASAAASLSPAKLAEFVTRATTEDFIFDINNGEINPFIGYCYTFNKATNTWDKSKIDTNSIKFCWDNDSAEVNWGDCNRWEWEYIEEGERYIVYVPKVINFIMKVEGVEQVSIALETNYTNSDSMAPAATMKVNGGYEFKVYGSADVKGVGMGGSITKNDTNIFSAAATVAINDMTNPDNWIVREWCDYHQTNHTYVDVSEYFVMQVKTGEMQVSILNLTIAMAGNFKDLAESMDSLYENISDKEQCCNAVCDLLNEKIKTVAVYTDTKEKIADIVWQARRYTYEDYDWETDSYVEVEDYYEEPILVFPDDSRFAFEDYFTERAFSSLLDTVDEFIESLDQSINELGN